MILIEPVIKSHCSHAPSPFLLVRKPSPSEMTSCKLEMELKLEPGGPAPNATLTPYITLPELQ